MHVSFDVYFLHNQTTKRERERKKTERKPNENFVHQNQCETLIKLYCTQWNKWQIVEYGRTQRHLRMVKCLEMEKKQQRQIIVVLFFFRVNKNGMAKTSSRQHEERKRIEIETRKLNRRDFKLVIFAVCKCNAP